MKKKLYLLTTILAGTAALMLSSCLKDKSHYLNFDTGQTFVDFPKGGFSGYGPQAITESAPDSVNGQPNDKEAITRVFAVNVASQNLPTSPTTVTIGVDPSQVAVINKLQSNVVYELMPANAYKLASTKVTIPAGQQYANTSVTFYKALLDPAKSYVLPIVITNGGGAKISANLNVLYYHFIGNDFAGVYKHYYTRWSVPDTTGGLATSDAGHAVYEEDETFFPVTPNEFTVYTYYYYQPSYDVTFTKTGTGAAATYSNFQVDFPADQIKTYFTDPSGGAVVLVNHPVIIPQDGSTYDPTKQYTYAEALKLFKFYYTTGSRAIIDTYQK